MSSPFIIIDEIGQKITDLVGANNGTPSVTTAGNAVTKTETVNQKINQISTYQIGSKGDTGGSTSAGSVMAKLNKIIGDVSTAITNIGTVNTAVTNVSNTLGNGTYGLNKIQALVATDNDPDINGILSKKLAAMIPYVVVPIAGSTYTKATIVSSSKSVEAYTTNKWSAIYGGSDSKSTSLSTGYSSTDNYGSFTCSVSGVYTLSVTGYRQSGATGNYNNYAFLCEYETRKPTSSSMTLFLNDKYVALPTASSATVTTSVELVGGVTYYLNVITSTGTGTYKMYITNAKITYSLHDSI